MTYTHGDVTALTNQTGSITKRYNYDAFGVETAKNQTDSNPFRYSGEYFDTETDSIYLRNRYYSPASGRFLTQDPIMDGENWYVYANNNPIMFIDPEGLTSMYQALGDFKMGIESGLSPLDLKKAKSLSDDAKVQMHYKFKFNTKSKDKNLFETKRFSNGKEIFDIDILITWDNQVDAFRHFVWNVDLVGEFGSSKAKIVTNNHELNAMKNKDQIISNKNGIVEANINLSTLMDIHNNAAGRNLANDSVHSSKNNNELFDYALKNGFLITDPTQTRDVYGFTADEQDKNKGYTIRVKWDTNKDVITVINRKDN